MKGRQTVDGSSKTYRSFIGLTDEVHKKVSVVTGKLAFTEGFTNFIGN